MRKVRISSESGEKYAQIKQRLQAKTVLHKYVGGFWNEMTTGDGLFYWRKCYYEWTHSLARNDGLK